MTKTAEKKTAPKIIPPRTVVTKLACPDDVCALIAGRRFRVGYYSRKDGLGVIWLVNEAGVYEQSWPRRGFERHFAIDRLTTETDFFGESKPTLRPLKRGWPTFGRRR